MKRLEESLSYLGSSSVAGAEALVRLAVAGVEIGFDPEAMGGGDDPLIDYFGKVEAAGADQANKFLQWADEQAQKGVRQVNIQGLNIPLAVYKDRLEEIKLREQQIVSGASANSVYRGGEPTLFIVGEAKALKSIQKDKADAKNNKEQGGIVAQLRPETISERLREILTDSPRCKEPIGLLEKIGFPQLISGAISYLVSDSSNRLTAEGLFVEDMSRKPPFRLAAKAIGVSKSAPVLSIMAHCSQPETLLERRGELIIVPAPCEDVVGLRDEIVIDITQKRRLKYLAEQCFGFSYPTKEGDEFYPPESSKDIFSVRFQTMKRDGKLCLYVSTNGSIEGRLVVQPDEINVKKSIGAILAGMEK